MTTEQQFQRLENELREIKTMMRILVPQYADERKRYELLFNSGKVNKKERGILCHQKEMGSHTPK